MFSKMEHGGFRFLHALTSKISSNVFTLMSKVVLRVGEYYKGHEPGASYIKAKTLANFWFKSVSVVL